jgi:hypothetical protein
MITNDAAGIYLRGQDLPCTEVGRVVEEYWTARGAFRIEHDPYLIPPFDAGRTGRLSISLTRVSPGWILVRDSERFTCDWELARALHEALRVETLAYTVSESIDRAHAMRWCAGELLHAREPAQVQALLTGLPGAFEILSNARPLEEPTDAVFLTFDGVGLPSKLRSSYAGPDLDGETGRSLLERKGRFLLGQCSLELPRFLNEFPFLASSIFASLVRLPMGEAAAQKLVLALEPMLFEHNQGLEQLAYAAHRAGLPELVTRAEAALKAEKRLAARRNWVYLLAGEGAWNEALAAFEELEAREAPTDQELNNLCFILAHLEPDALPSDTMARYLARARERAKKNPYIFHNLACVLLRRGDVEGALDCVEGAIAHHYPLIERMREDGDLAVLHECSRWRTAWAQYDEQHRVQTAEADDGDDGDELDEDLVQPTRKIVVPGVGIELEGVGMIPIDINVDDLIDLVGEVSNDLDAAHGIYRFEQIGLVWTGWDGRELISHVDGDLRTIVAGVDVWPLDAREAVTRVWEALGEEPFCTDMDDGDWDYVFREAGLTLTHCPEVSGARLSNVIVRHTPRAHGAMDLEGSLRMSEAERVSRAAEQEQREQALRSHFARLDRQVEVG